MYAVMHACCHLCVCVCVCVCMHLCLCVCCSFAFRTAQLCVMYPSMIMIVHHLVLSLAVKEKERPYIVL